MPGSKYYATPFVLPIAAFLAAILAGSFFLSLEICAANAPVPFIDALFTAVSAVCVTGLASVDVFAAFNRTGQWTVLILMQLGGLGIITYTTLILHLVGRRISLRDRLAVTQGLLYGPDFNLGAFLRRMVTAVFALEGLGAVLLWSLDPQRMTPFNALFMAVSSFCNCGFAPWPDNLAQWRDNWAVCLTVMSLIVLGGLGFFVLNDLFRLLADRLRRARRGPARPYRLTFYSRLVLATSFFLIAAGALAVFLAELGNPAWSGMPLAERALVALFQSVTSRTAGFATADMARFSEIALLATIVLMFIGGSPASCAGGIKTTAFRIVCSGLLAQLRGRSQTVVAGRAMDDETRSKAALLVSYSLLTIFAASMALTLTENGPTSLNASAVPFFELFFEAVSAFATVGLSVNVTPRLSDAGKCILCAVMFIGKLGPVWLVTTIRQFHTGTAYRYPEDSLPVG